MWIGISFVIAVIVSAIILTQWHYNNSETIEIIHVSRRMFSKLQSIYEFREDMQKGIITNAPLINSENVVTSIVLTIKKKNKDIKLIKEAIRKFQIEINNEANTDKYI